MKQHIENLIALQVKNETILSRDIVYVRNQLYHLVKEIPQTPFPSYEPITYPSDALNPILDVLEQKKILDGSFVARDLMDAKIMNIFASLPSVVESKFYAHYNKSSKNATNWLYQYAQSLNYIRYDRILKNESFTYDSEYAPLQITINLSKPEKDPKSIIQAGKTQSVDYPKCVLCIENEGFSGNALRDSRDQHRLIQLKLNNEAWYFQYSPYIYYPEHTIILSHTHRPMKISQQTFENLFSLVKHFDGYFFGSNADLPIVGGSILSHDHYQGGKHKFPIEDAKTIKTWQLDNLELSILNWPLSTIRLRSKNDEDITAFANKILNKWRSYHNENLNIIAFSNDKTPHNTITPIARKNGNHFELDLVLRNNYVNEQYPLGIFHPHADKWHIKKENIGLIEAIGLAILPARLKHETKAIKDYILNKKENTTLLKQHQTWINSMLNKYQFTKTNIDKIIRNEIGHIFTGVLEDCGVFKKDQIAVFEEFINEEIYEKRT